MTNYVHSCGIARCERKATQLACRIPGSGVNVGSGESSRWSGLARCDARLGTADFNTRPLPFSDNAFSLVVCEQVIEHLHNTTFFISELYRILKIGGSLLLSTENLASWPNRLALLLGFAPFSCQPVCGRYIGGFKQGQLDCAGFAANHPSFSGVTGHVRVLTAEQLKRLLQTVGFKIRAQYNFIFGHYILIEATKA